MCHFALTCTGFKFQFQRECWEHAEINEFKHAYDHDLKREPKLGSYDAVIVAVNHKEYSSLNESYFKSLMRDDKGVIIDVKGIYRGKIKDLVYWGL